MCGRFTLQISPEMLAEIFGMAEIPVIPARFNIAPTQQIPVIRQYADYTNHLDELRWGFIPSWQKDPPTGAPLINARCETIADKPSFRQAIRYRRCLIPASGFYEWRREGENKTPYYIRLNDGSPMVFGGIWETWKGPDNRHIDSCAIITTSANDLVAPLHDRMPVILHPAEYEAWLDRDQRDPEKVKRLFEPFPAEMMETFPVSPQVNSSKSEGPGLVVPC